MSTIFEIVMQYQELQNWTAVEIFKTDFFI